MRFGASEFRIVVHKRKEWMRCETFDVRDRTYNARGEITGEGERKRWRGLFARIRFANTNMSGRWEPVLFGRGERI